MHGFGPLLVPHRGDEADYLIGGLDAVSSFWSLR